MGTYTIKTSREQEIGLDYSYAHFAGEGQTPEQYLQGQVNHKVLNPMWVEQQQATSIAFDKSFATIPEANEAAATQQIQDVIVANGGTLVPVGPPPDPLATARARGTT